MLSYVKLQRVMSNILPLDVDILDRGNYSLITM